MRPLQLSCHVMPFRADLLQAKVGYFAALNSTPAEKRQPKLDMAVLYSAFSSTHA